MKKSKAVILLLRLPFLTVTIGAVLLGTAFAWKETGKFNLLMKYLINPLLMKDGFLK